MKRAVVFLGCLVLAVPASAFGQDGPPPPQNGTSQGVGVGAYGRLTNEQFARHFESEEMRRRHSLTPEEAAEEYGPERLDLARRVQTLVEDGKCREARELANGAGERGMALRVRQTCRSR